MRIISDVKRLGAQLEIIDRKWLRERGSGLYLLAHSRRKLHHSTSDWDFLSYQGGTWTLSTAYYVSSPSCLKLRATYTVSGWSNSLAVCKIAGMTDLKEGRLVSQVYMEAIPTGSVGVDYDVPFVYGVIDSQTFQLTTADIALEAWKKSRVTWWNSFDLQNVAKLATRLDTFVSGNWVTGSITYKSRLTGSVNGCGVAARYNKFSGSMEAYWDDTEIWG